ELRSSPRRRIRLDFRLGACPHCVRRRCADQDRLELGRQSWTFARRRRCRSLRCQAWRRDLDDWRANGGAGMKKTRRPGRLPRWQEWSVYATLGALIATGIAWLLFDWFVRVNGEFGPGHHPAEHWTLIAHGVAAYAFLI